MGCVHSEVRCRGADRNSPGQCGHEGLPADLPPPVGPQKSRALPERLLGGPEQPAASALRLPSLCQAVRPAELQ